MSVFDEVMSKEANTPVYNTFGQLDLEVRKVALIKGQGKVDWDDEVHPHMTYSNGSPMRPSFSIKMTITDVRNGQPRTREVLQSNNEWQKIIWPSLIELGISTGKQLEALNGAYVQVQSVPSGDSYVDKQGNTKEGTTFKFLRIFKNEDECYQASGNKGSPVGSHNVPQSISEADLGAPFDPTPASEISAEASAALTMLPSLWKTAKQDLDKFKALVNKNPLFQAVGITADHPKVQDFLKDAF